jgi:hypothetical protein
MKKRKGENPENEKNKGEKETGRHKDLVRGEGR